MITDLNTTWYKQNTTVKNCEYLMPTFPLKLRVHDFFKGRKCTEVQSCFILQMDSSGRNEAN